MHFSITNSRQDMKPLDCVAPQLLYAWSSWTPCLLT